MIRLPRDRRGYNRFTPWRVGLFFLAAGVWLGGVTTERPTLTGAAILIVAVALVLGFFGRQREHEGSQPPE